MKFDLKRFEWNIFWLLTVLVLCFIVVIALTPWQKNAIVEFDNPEAIEYTESVIDSLSWQQKVIYGPVMEELRLRGPLFFLTVLFWKFDKLRYMRYKILLLGAVLFSALFFVAIHVGNGGIYSLQPTLLMLGFHGVLYGLLTVKTRNILYPITAHSSWNALMLAIG